MEATSNIMEKLFGIYADFFEVMSDVVLINTLSAGVLVTLFDGIEQIKSRRRKLQFRLGNSLS